MAIKRVDLTALQQTVPVVDAEGRPSPLFLRFINGAILSLRNGVNSLIDVQNAVAAANAAAATAQTAANNAAAAASTANGAATAAQASATATSKEQALINSYISPASVLSATTTTITVAAHTRYYADGTSVAVNAGTVAATAPSDTDYVSYTDTSRTGGAVTYLAGTTQPAQGSGVHVVGAVTIPVTGTQAGGAGPRKPGYVAP